MNISNNGLNFIIKHEGIKLSLYLDIANYYTIGVGHKCSNQEIIDYNNGITKQQALDLLMYDLIVPCNSIKNLQINFLSNQADALISLIFNIGSGQFSKSSLKKTLLINHINYEQIYNDFIKFSYVKNTFVKSLYNRRVKEAELYIKSIY